ncbi:MAG TPA: site-specific integrase [Streptosporangiaceae bacterium]
MTGAGALVPGRAARLAVPDRLEMLTALIAAPSFDPLFRAEAIQVPAGHPVFRWSCVVPQCRRGRGECREFCAAHQRQWTAARECGTGLPAFLAMAEPQPLPRFHDGARCRICPGLPAAGRLELCGRHRARWNTRRRRFTGFAGWCASQTALPGYGTCQVVSCPALAASPLRLCLFHDRRYEADGRPGAARLPGRWVLLHGPVGAVFGDKTLWREWCRRADPPCRNNGRVSLLGARPLLRAEIQWLLCRRTQQPDGRQWTLMQVQSLVNQCRGRDLNSLTEADLSTFPELAARAGKGMITQLRLIYYTRADTRRAGFLETDHFGVRFNGRGSHFSLTEVTQPWLRDLLWDWMAARLTAAAPPRSPMPLVIARRGCVELSAFLRASARAGGDDPVLLSGQDAIAFIAGQRDRARHGLPELGIHRRDGAKTTARPGTAATIFDGARCVLRAGLESGACESLGLDRAFVTAVPYGGVTSGRRRPFPDEAARALAAEVNLAALHARDEGDRGLRDIWETLVTTGRRSSEVPNLRLGCLGRCNGLAMLWHDQTKAGRYDQAIRIPEPLHERLARRQAVTCEKFEHLHGRPPTTAERNVIALFPRKSANLTFTHAVSSGWFTGHFRVWADGLGVGACVPHQARHSLATALLRNGATLSHVKRYLGQVSERMAEHYVHLASTDPALEDALNTIWVTGPGGPEPGTVISAGPGGMTPVQAQALMIDLTRTSTPAEGGFCTFQPVVRGCACPWNLNCHGCEKFVMSGADLLYWRRKQEQWATLAERAPDDATASYLHDVFAPTARAIDGLEQALRAAGLHDAALQLDLRRPQDYFTRVWSIAFRADGLSRPPGNAATVQPGQAAAAVATRPS